MDVGERLSLETVDPNALAALDRRHRYTFAARACEERSVIELGCGRGDGTRILAKNARTVLGVDRDVASVDAASAYRGADANTEFRAMGALECLRSLTRDEVDVVVCFDAPTLFSDVGDAAAELSRLVRAGVGLVASVANDESGEESARALFGDLPGLTIVPQCHAEGSLIAAAGVAPHAAVDVLDGPDPDSAAHLVVLAGLDAEVLFESPTAMLSFAAAPVHLRALRDLELANRELRTLNAWLARGRLGLGAAGAASATIRHEEQISTLQDETARLETELEWMSHAYAGAREAHSAAVQAHDAAVQAYGRGEQHVTDLLTEIDRLRGEVEGVAAERDRFRESWVTLHSSRIMTLAARVTARTRPRP